MDADLFTEKTIEEKLNNGEYVMLMNKKDFSPTWSDLRLIADAKEPNKPFIGWAVCQFCQAAFRTHSKINNQGKRKNHGLTSCTRHLQHCRPRQKEMAQTAKENSSFDSFTANSQSSCSQFSVNKRKIAPSWLHKLKEAEAKFVVEGMHSFKSVEHSGLKNLAQTCLDIGARWGRIDIRDIWFAENSIRDECHNKFISHKNKIKNQIKTYAKDRVLSATIDLWRDDTVARYNMDFTVFWIDNNWELKHAILRSKRFEEHSKTEINLWNELESIFHEFDLIIDDVPITTDEGANIKDPINDKIWLPCMAHCCSSALEMAWKATAKICPDFQQLIYNISELQSFIALDNGFQASLANTIKKNSDTCPWRSCYEVIESVLSSYDNLLGVLSGMFEESRILCINKDLVSSIVGLMKQFMPILDALECSKVPNIHVVVPSYYAMSKIVQLNGQESPVINLLKVNIQIGLNEQYWPSILQLHWVATYLDPSFRDLSFVTDKSYRITQLKLIEEGLTAMAIDIENQQQSISNDSIDFKPSTKKYRTEDSTDPFAKLRNQSPVNFKLDEKGGLLTESANYTNLSYSTDSDNTASTLLEFWRTYQVRSPLLASIAKRILVIQGSSSKSERHFSAGGTVIADERSRTNDDTVQSLIILRECLMNNQWPDSGSDIDKGEIDVGTTKFTSDMDSS